MDSYYWFWLPCYVLITFTSLTLLWIMLTRLFKTKCNIEGFHVLIFVLSAKYFTNMQHLSSTFPQVTGGSSGIGKCIAVEAAQLGANVTIIARDEVKLKDACRDIQKYRLSSSQKFQYISLDLRKDYENVTNMFAEAEYKLGPIDMLVNCAGMALCGKLEDMSIEDAYHLINVNYIGTLHATKAVVRKMKDRRSGRIVITASQAALFGVFGYTIYSSTKYALRGFAEALYMEVKPYGITVTLGLPADTDTPGFANEEKSKPLETKLISETGGLYKPEIVAAQLMKDALNGKFFSTVGLEGFMLTIISCGMAPFSSMLELFTQVLLMGLLRLVAVIYQLSFYRIIKNCALKQESKKFL